MAYSGVVMDIIGIIGYEGDLGWIWDHWRVFGRIGVLGVFGGIMA